MDTPSFRRIPRARQWNASRGPKRWPSTVQNSVARTIERRCRGHESQDSSHRGKIARVFVSPSRRPRVSPPRDVVVRPRSLVPASAYMFPRSSQRLH